MSILNLSYNQKTSNLIVCTDTGYTIYGLANNLEKKKEVKKGGGIGIMKMLYTSNIFLEVGGGDNPYMARNIAIMYNIHKDEETLKINTESQIKNILIDHKHIIIVLQKKVIVFDFNGSNLDSKITYTNDRGICVMNMIETMPTIATLGQQKGEIAIWRPTADKLRTIKAHNSNIRALAINREGTLVASVSETGTLVKVYNTDSCKQIYELRRGTTTAEIYDICFNMTSTLLACCSNTGTIHIFELNKDLEKSKNIKSTLSDYKEYLPEYFSSQWSFKQVYINTTSKMICGFDEQDILHVTTFDGKYYRISGKDKDWVVKEDDLKVFSK